LNEEKIINEQKVSRQISLVKSQKPDRQGGRRNCSRTRSQSGTLPHGGNNILEESKYQHRVRTESGSDRIRKSR